MVYASLVGDGAECGVRLVEYSARFITSMFHKVLKALFVTRQHSAVRLHRRVERLAVHC